VVQIVSPGFEVFEMQNCFLINANWLVLLFAVMAFSELSLASTGDEVFSNDLMSQCAAVMSPPIRFKVNVTRFDEKSGISPVDSFLTKLRGSEVSTFLTPSGLEKVIEQARFKGEEYVVSVAEESTQRVTKIEQVLGKLTHRVIVVGDSRCFEFHPKQNTVIDTSFNLRDVQGVWGEMTDICRLNGEVVCKEDSGERWLCRATGEKLIVELRISKVTKFVESKRIFDRNSKKLLKEYRYSGFESANFPASFFSTDSATVFIAENSEDYSSKRVEFLRDSMKAHISTWEAKRKELRDHVPYRVDPKSGRQILNPPPGMSNEEFARGIGEAIEKLPTPKGISKDKQNELAEKWKANTELKPIDITPPHKANRGYGNVWFYLGIFLALSTAFVVGIRFWRAN